MRRRKQKYLYSTHPYERRPNGALKTCSVHVRIWILHYGAIPKGYVVHHKNFDRYDNRIENLCLMKRKPHEKLHLEHRKKMFKLKQQERGW